MKSMSRILALEGNIRVLAFQTLLSQLGFGMFYVVWQPYIISTGVSMVELGLLQSVINISTAAGLLAWGPISDRFGRKPAILASNVSRTLALIALVISSNFYFLVAFAFFVGFSALFMQANPARSALIAETVGQQRRATALSTLMAISQITMTVTASVGGYLALNVGFHAIFYICIIGDIAGLTLMALFVRETGVEQTHEKPQGGTLSFRLVNLLRPEKAIRRLYVLMVIFGLGYGIGYSLFYAMLVDNFKFSTVNLGLMSTVFNLTWGLSSIPLGRLSDILGRKPMFIMSSIMSILTLIGFIFSTSIETFLLFNVTNALDIAFFAPAWISFISEKVRSGSLSTVMGKLDAYIRLASIPAPWMGGLLYMRFGFRAPLIVDLVFMLTALTLLATLREKGSKG